MSESKLVYDCIQLLGKYGAVFRTNSGRFYAKSGRSVSGLPKGFSDLLFIRPDGIACFIELKTGKNKASPEQEQFIAKMQKQGAFAGIARTAEEALEICRINTKN